MLNYKSDNATHIPDELKVPWGDAIRTLRSAKATLHKFGTPGSATAQHNKQAIVSTLIVQDENKNILNRNLLKEFVPHKSDNGTNQFIRKCKRLREEFNTETYGYLCDLTRYKRNSLVLCDSLNT